MLEAHFPRIISIARRLGASQGAAEEIARATMAQARALRPYFPDVELREWLDVMTKRAYCNHVLSEHFAQAANNNRPDLLNPRYSGDDPTAQRFALLEVD